MNKISFQDTHVYPGCLAIFHFHVDPNQTTLSALAEFSDDVIAQAEVEQVNPEEMLIHIESYMTAHGTHIPEKTWRLQYDKDQDIWKVIKKI